MFDIFTLFSSFQDVGMLIARIIFGIIFIYFGLPKLKNLKSNANDFVSMGFKPGWLWGTAVALLEVFGGLAVIVGLWIEVFATIFAIHMIVGTIWKIAKTEKPFTDWSYDLLLLALAIIFAVAGSGAYALGNLGLY